MNAFYNKNPTGDILKSNGELQAASRLFERTLMINENLFGPLHLQVADSLFRLAETLHEACDLDQALPLFERAHC
jgi:hypothetical protein